MKIKSYSELITIPTLVGRFEYVKIQGKVSDITFGNERWINQRFYSSYEWRKLRDEIIIRDGGCEFGLADYPIMGSPIIHHLNPIRPLDLMDFNDAVINPDNLISVSHQVHNAIHYSDESLLPKDYVPRFPGDTKEW